VATFNDFPENQLTKTSNLSQNLQEGIMATNICFLTNFYRARANENTG